MSETTAVALPTQNSSEKFSIALAVENPQQIRDLIASAADLDKMEAAPLNIAVQYFDFQMGQPVRFYFMGITDIASQETGETMPAVVLMDSKQNTYTNAGALLVSTFVEQNIPRGTPIEITWLGLKKTAKGNARTWSVKPLLKAK